jgi:predicted phage tail protein
VTDSLRSTSYVRALDVISEGPIEGLVDGLRSVYLDDTRLQNADGTFNFQGFKIVERNGDAAQAPIEGFSSVESITSVGVRVQQAAPVVRTITNPNTDAVLVTIGVPALQSTDQTTGAVSGALVRMTLEVQPNGGAWVRAAADAVVGPLAGTGFGDAYATVPQDVIATRIEPRVTISNAAAAGAYEYRVEYRLSDGTPVDLAANWSLSRQAFMEVSTATTAYGSDSEGGPTTYVVYTASESFELRAFTGDFLAPGRYDLRVTLLSGGAASISIGGTYFESLPSIRIAGKTSSRYQRQYRVPLPAGGAPWSIRLTRTTADSGSAFVQNETWWDSYTEVVSQRLRYPYSAMLAVSIDASQFSSIPTRAYDVRLRRVQVPVNYNPITRVYTGSWNGTFKTAWTDNPAWCFYDLLTHPRYGLGAFVGTGVDKWTLYSIAQYCDQLVPNGFGGQEPRFTCNIIIGSKAEAFRVLNDIASIFRGLIYWAAGGVTAAQDAPSDPVALFTPANVIDGAFSYSGSSAKVRHTAALVTWNDPQDLCRQKVEYVEDREGINRYGLVMTEVVAVGCTSRGQASRVGRWLLFSERLQTDAVAFKVGLEGAIVRPGNVIKVADPGRAGVRFGGRLLAASTTNLTLDAAVTLVAGQTYTLSCLRADGTVQERTVTTGAGTVSTLVVSPALAEAPAVGSIWVLQSAAVEAQLFRVLTITESARQEFEITAIEHEPSKYASIEQGLKLLPRSISALSAVPPAPTQVSVVEKLALQAGRLTSSLDITWPAVPGASSYVARFRAAQSNEGVDRPVSFPSINPPDVAEGAYELLLWSVNAFGTRSSSPSVTPVLVVGKTAPPSDVQGYVVTRLGETVAHAWRPVPDLDLARYEVRRGATWDTGIVVGAPINNDLQVLAPRGGRHMVKAVDTSGNYSRNEAVVDLPDISGINVVAEFDDGAGGFNGPKNQTAEIRLFEAIPWALASTWDEAANWDAFIDKRGVTIVGLYTWADMTMPWTAYRGSWLFEGAAVDPYYVAPWNTMTAPWSTYDDPWQVVERPTSGTYISETIDVGYESASLVTIEPSIDLLADSARPWNAYTETWAYYGSGWSWQGPVGLIGAEYEVSTSLDNVTWSAWTRLTLGALRLRYLRIRVTLTTQDGAYRPWLTGLIVNVDVPDRVVHVEDVAVPLAGATISWAPAFVGIKTVQVTLQSAASGDRFTVTGKSETGVTVQVFDSAGAPKVGLVDVDAFGHGERY